MKALNEKQLLLISTVIVSYFSTIYLLYIYEIEYILIGVFREILSIPFLIAHLVFLATGVIWLIKRKHSKPYRKVLSILLLGTCSYLTLTSFF